MKSDRNVDNNRFAALGQILEGHSTLLIVLHHNPDPDALASAFALRYWANKQYNIQTTIAYSGLIGRAENRAMVRELKIPLRKIEHIRFSYYSRIALLDTQPGAGNNLLPPGVECHIVIDHHPIRPKLNSKFVMIEPQLGAAATMLVQLLDYSGLPIPVDLATALTYAIRTETQDLGREVTEQDLKAYFLVYPKACMHKLHRISQPKLSRSYFVSLTKSLQRTMVFRHLICAHLGEIPIPEIVAEMADFLLRHQRISWVLCTGRFENTLFLSLRSSNTKARAGKLIKKLVPDPNNAGGHDMFAGGRIVLKEGLQEEDITAIEATLSQQFAELLGHANANWKPLIENS